MIENETYDSKLYFSVFLMIIYRIDATVLDLWRVAIRRNYFHVKHFSGPMLSSGYSWRAIFYAFFGLSFFTFIVFFIRASEKPEEIDHPLNKLRPLRFSKTIDTSEGEFLTIAYS